MCVSSPYLAVECLHELRHLLALLPVIAGEQLHHAVDAPLDVAHALMLINVIELHLCRIVIFAGFFIIISFLLLFHLYDVLLANDFVNLLFLPLQPDALLVKHALEDHGRVESLISGHERRVDVLADQVVRLHLRQICTDDSTISIKLRLQLLELDVVEIGLHFEGE